MVLCYRGHYDISYFFSNVARIPSNVWLIEAMREMKENKNQYIGMKPP